MMKKISKKWMFVIVLLFAFFLNAALLDRGFCYSEMAFLSKRQMLDRSIFGPNADSIGQAEMAAILKRTNFDYYPNNCVFTNGSATATSSSDEFIHGLLGKKFFGIECVYPRDASEYKDTPYYVSMWSISSCGSRSSDSFGEGISEQSFKAIIRNNAKFWEGQK